MAFQRHTSIGTGLLVLSVALGALTGAQAAPLRLSLDAMAAPGPTGEPAQPPRAPQADDEPSADAELSFVAVPELAFPAATEGAATDAEWLLAARSQQDEAAQAAERRLGEFAPQAPAPLVPSEDPIDAVQIAAGGPAEPAAKNANTQLPVVVPDRSVLVWMVVPTLVLALGLAWWADRRGGGRRRSRSLAAR